MRNPTALGSFNPTQQKTGSRAIEKPGAYWPSKSSMRIQKPFRMISLRKTRQQLPWIDILTKNTGGWGYIPWAAAAGAAPVQGEWRWSGSARDLRRDPSGVTEVLSGAQKQRARCGLRFSQPVGI